MKIINMIKENTLISKGVKENGALMCDFGN
jgi:hypothetical protein